MATSSRFVGRRKEMAAIEKELDRRRPSLLAVYGRRRVGKSTLLARATGDRPTIYYQATKVVGSMNLDLLRKEIGDFVGERDPLLEGIEQWEALLSYVISLAGGRSEPLTLVIDEFPYICETVKALPSILQKIFDTAVADGIPLNLVLCGSQIAFMEELLGEENPLRGRQTLELNLEPMPYRDAAEFFPDWSLVERLSAYGVFGGMPYYLQLCDPEQSLRQNILDVVLDPGAPLSNEAFNVLQAELSSPTRYATILQAVASGCTTTGEILGRTREISDSRALAPYIKKLEALRLIRITRSLDAAPRGRNRRYYLADPFLAFWFRFCTPNSSAIATGHGEELYRDVIEAQFSDYMGEIFEWIGRQYVSHYATRQLSTAAGEVGKIWGSDYDIDIAATLLDGSVLYGECKWWSRKVGENVLDQLKEDAAKTDYGDDADTVHWMLISRSGFTDELRQRSSHCDTLHLVTPADLLCDAPG